MIPDCVVNLEKIGISRGDAFALRRIAMTFHRWHELECGDGNDYNSWCVARGRKDKDGAFIYDENGDSYLEEHRHNENHARYSRIPDRQRGAQKRLVKIMGEYPALKFYVQSDPRGPSLYILRPADVPAGMTAAECYTRGVAVYR